MDRERGEVGAAFVAGMPFGEHFRDWEESGPMRQDDVVAAVFVEGGHGVDFVSFAVHRLCRGSVTALGKEAHRFAKCRRSDYIESEEIEPHAHVVERALAGDILPIFGRVCAEAVEL